MTIESPAAPFTQAVNSAMTQAQTAAQSAFDEFSRMFSGMKLPAVADSDALMAAYKRNMEALTQANRVAMEGAQAVARRHMEIVQQTMGEMGETMRALTSTTGAQDRAATQSELLRRAYERAVGHTRDMAELIRNSNAEALGLLNKRVVEAMEEIKALTNQAGGSTPTP